MGHRFVPEALSRDSPCTTSAHHRKTAGARSAQHDRIATGSIRTEGHAVAEGHDPKKSPVASGVRLRQGSLPSMCDSAAGPLDGAVERGARQPDGNHIVSLR